MKNIFLVIFAVINILLLSSCLPAVQLASTVHTAITVENDRRTSGVIIDDRSFYLKLSGWVLNDKKLNNSHINFMVYDKNALITGEVPIQVLQTYVETQARLQVPQLKRIFNETTVGPNKDFLSRGKDSVITLQIEAMFQDQEVFHPVNVKIMTEDQVVYLMGAVTKREGNMAAKIASRAKNVKKIVKLFDYLAKRPLAEIRRDEKRRQEHKAQEQKKAEKAIVDAKKAKLYEQIRALDNEPGTDFSPQK